MNETNTMARHFIFYAGIVKQKNGPKKAEKLADLWLPPTLSLASFALFYLYFAPFFYLSLCFGRAFKDNFISFKDQQKACENEKESFWPLKTCSHRFSFMNRRGSLQYFGDWKIVDFVSRQLPNFAELLLSI